jgi:geranylgeranyl diphosphate synthase type I
MMNIYASSQRARIEKRIPELIEASSASPLEDVPSSKLMQGVIRQALTSSKGGKRLRALLAVAAGDAASGLASNVATPLRPDALLDIACAIEIFQTGALVHDDIIDDSDLRRGIPAAHRGLAQIFATFSSSLSRSAGLLTSSQTVGNGLGIMLGDLLATQSLLVVSHAGADCSMGAALTAAFLRMQREVEIGQVMDLADTAVRLDDPDTMIDNCLAVFRWKTASYTSIAPLELGFISAGAAPHEARAWAERIGTPLGTAFQLADDLIDVQSGTQPSGKPLGGDIKEGKHTVLLADALREASAADRRTLRSIYSSPQRDDADIATVINIFKRSGAIERSQERINQLWEQTGKQLTAWSRDRGASESAHSLLSDICALFLPNI